MSEEKAPVSVEVGVSVGQKVVVERTDIDGKRVVEACNIALCKRNGDRGLFLGTRSSGHQSQCSAQNEKRLDKLHFVVKFR